MTKEAKYYVIIDEKTKKIQCRLCPHNCLLEEDKIGKCRVRKNIQGKLHSLTYSIVSSIAIDPIEKKPLYHFYPGSVILSVGSFGCNFKCGFCQNWEISQVSVEETSFYQQISPQQLLHYAKKYEGNIGIAYTYNEPLINFEFILETAKLFHKEGYVNVLVTNGYINKEPLLELLPYIDAANIDLKSFNKDFYRKICDGNLNFVLQTIETFLMKNKHIELTTLIIPQHNDSEEEIGQIVGYVAGLSKDIPLHFSKYYPMYKFNIPSTEINKLEIFYTLAKEKLHYVYLGNVLEEKYNSTYCVKCKNVLIKRIGYNIIKLGLQHNGICKFCGCKNYIIM
ncbi:MAG: AmmeMemoRadiSam system radical SAM enzyme [Endomicrobia bacterium]|nr:AmmeMemoRadiSam system radical SAM enzyme [Endomicrobiia bacterium]